MKVRTASAASQFASKFLIFVAALFVLISWSLSAFQMAVERQEMIDRSLSDTGNLVDVLREHTRESLRVVDQGLYGLSTSVNIERLGDPTAAADIHLILNRRLAATPGILQFIITDTHDVMRYSSATPNPAPEDMSWRPEYELLRNGEPGETVIMPTLMGRIGAAKGKPIIVMARRLQNKAGDYLGSVSAAISLDDFATVARALKLGNEGAFGMIHTDGTMMMRVPDMPDLIGRQMTDVPFVHDILKNPDAGMVSTATTPGREYGVPSGTRYVTYRRIPDTTIVVYVAKSETDILRPWRDELLLIVAQQSALALLVVFLVGLARASLKRRADEEAAHLERLSDLSAVTAELMKHQDLDALLNDAAQVMRRIVPSQQSAIHHYAPGQSYATGSLAVSLSDRYPQWRGATKRNIGSDIYSLAGGANQTLRLTQAELEALPIWPDIAKARANCAPLRGILAAPLTAHDGHNIGYVILSDRDTGDYDAGDEAVLTQLARVVSITLENIRLLAETRRAATHAQTAAEEAEDARNNIAKVFTATSDAIVIFDQDMRYIFINDAFSVVTGVPRENILGQTLYERLPKSKTLHEKLELCRNTQKRVDFENVFVRPDGQKRWIEVRAFPMDGKIVVGIRDTTDRRLADQKLMEAQRMDAVGRLTGGLAHDFNNLLAVVMGNAEMLTLKLKDSADLRLANLIRSAALRGANLVSRLLAFARRQPLDPKSINIISAVNDVQGLLRRTLPENIAFKFAHSDDLWLAKADLPQLENVLVNLVMNARDAMPNGGEILIEARNAYLDQLYADTADVAPGPYVLLSVSDTGTGMTPEVRDRAFEPFFTTKEVGKGTGLGLSSAFGFVKQSGGHVRLESELGHGTTVKLYLPRALDNSAAGPPQPPTASDPSGTESIMLIEDDEMVRDFVLSMLKGLGYSVDAYADAETALAAIHSGAAPDLMLSDVILTGEMNGPQLAEKVKARHPTVRVLFMSGYTENAVVRGGQLQPGVHLLGKPFTRHELAVKIRSVLAG